MASVGSRQIAGEGTPARAWREWPILETLPRLSLEDLAPATGQVWIVAPHPDDEVLGCGGLMAMLAKAGRPATLVAVTDGGGSHPDSTQWPQSELLAARPRETLKALAELGMQQPEVIRLGIADGQVSAHEGELIDRLGALLQPGDTVFATWEFDGHPDHEATGRAARQACRVSGARDRQVPVWTWHWASPGDDRVPWETACRLDLDEQVHDSKRRALGRFVSQIRPDPTTGAEAILPDYVLERLDRPWEMYLR